VPCVVSFLPAFSCPRKWLYEIVALMSSSVPICYIEPTSLNLAVAIILILAIPLSYVPQYISIIRAKSSEGMSCLSLAVLLLGGLLTLINHSILNWDSIICCGLLTVKSCLANNLPGFQLFVGPFCITILYVLVLWFFDLRPVGKITHEQKQEQRKFGFLLFLGVLVLCSILAILAAIFYYLVHLPGEVLFAYAQALGIISTVTVVFQWGPQIWTTWKLKSQGSLSLLMLLIQMPGSLVVVVYQAILNDGHWTTWGPYVVATIQQMILIVLCLVFCSRERRHANPKYFPLTENSTDLQVQSTALA
jgi:uncharacterized protein with PQ loop repeat